jgi:hypothetical protein
MAEGSSSASSSGSPQWRDPRFSPAIEAVREACGSPHGREDDALIGMLLDRFSWDKDRVIEVYKTSVKKRQDLGLAEIKKDLVDNDLTLQTLPYAEAIRQVIAVNGSTSINKPTKGSTDGASSTVVDGKSVAYGDVIGCYEMRYGHGEPKTTDDPESVTCDQFARYMLYVTQWRWLQCEKYIHRHGELGFWSMIHDIECPAGYMSLWGRMRKLLGTYMPAVEDACGGLFPPMVQKILIINVPRIFGPAWTVISKLLPQHHKDRIVLLTTTQSNAAEVAKYVPAEHIPSHLGGPSPPPPTEIS